MIITIGNTKKIHHNFRTSDGSLPVGFANPKIKIVDGANEILEPTAMTVISNGQCFYSFDTTDETAANVTCYFICDADEVEAKEDSRTLDIDLITGDLNNLDAAISDVETKIDTIIGYIDTEIAAIQSALTTIQGYTDQVEGYTDTVETSLTTLLARLTAARAGYLDRIPNIAITGAGNIAHTITISEEDLTPIDDVQVWVTTDVGGSNIIASGRTNASGEIILNLDAGTYYQWSSKSGTNFTNPKTITVSEE